MSVTILDGTPYKGLTPYSEEDAPFFFGREAEREIIAANLMASRLTLLYGPSGVGKTSLLHAGVAHDLRRLARRNLAERGVPELAVVVFSSWRDDPVSGLLESVRKAVEGLLENDVLDPNPELSPRLDETFQSWTHRLGGDVLIILDQFEEYFLYHGQERHDGSFALEFSRAVNRADLPVSFLISIRDDALARLDSFKGLVPNLFENYLRVEHLDVSAARRAIEAPIAQYNRLSDGAKTISIEPGLVDAVLEQVQTGAVDLGLAGAGASPIRKDSRIEAPYLQLVMTRLWEEEIESGSNELRLSTLNQLGGAKLVIRTHLDEAVSALPPKEQDVAADVFHYLVTPSGSKVAHGAEDLANYAGLQDSELVPVLEKLARNDVRILRPIAPSPNRPGTTRYEIFHDVLASSILDWRLRHLEARKLAHAEEVSRKRRRLMQLSIVALVLIGMILAMVVLRQRRELDAVLSLQGSVTSLAFSPDGKLATLGADGTVQLWDLTHGKAKSTNLSDHGAAISSVAFSPDGKLATGGADGIIVLWDPGRLGAPGIVLPGHFGAVYSMAFTLGGRKMATGGLDGTIRLWDLDQRGTAPTVLRGHDGAVFSVAFSPDGRKVATGGLDGTIRLWDLDQRGTAPTVLQGQNGAVSLVAFSPDGKTLASGGLEGIVLLRTEDGSITTSSSSITSTTMTATTRPATTTTTRTLTPKRGVTPVPRKSFFERPEPLISELPASTTSTGPTTSTTGTRPAPTTTTPSWFKQSVLRVPVVSVAFSRDGRLVATGGKDGRARIWSLDKLGEPLTVLRGHNGSVSSVAFSPDGRLVATGGQDGTVHLSPLDKDMSARSR